MANSSVSVDSRIGSDAAPRRILVTGGAGSIGSAVVRRLIRDGHSPVVMDVSEEGLWRLRQEVVGEFILGDVQFLEDCLDAVRACDLVIHCAAYKHVWCCEGSPIAAGRVNILGTENMLRAAGERSFVLVSTDKAVEPCSIMGQTKERAEKLVLEAGGRVVRFGNVIGSTGSLLPAVARYAELGVPIPLTDRRMTRFVMTLADAVDMIIQSVSGDPGCVNLPADLRSVRVSDFLEVCRDLLYPGGEIVETMPGLGERFHERMRLSDGLIAVSNDPKYLMARDEIESLIAEACQRLGVLSVDRS